MEVILRVWILGFNLLKAVNPLFGEVSADGVCQSDRTGAGLRSIGDGLGEGVGKYRLDFFIAGRTRGGHGDHIRLVLHFQSESVVFVSYRLFVIIRLGDGIGHPGRQPFNADFLLFGGVRVQINRRFPADKGQHAFDGSGGYCFLYCCFSLSHLDCFIFKRHSCGCGFVIRRYGTFFIAFHPIPGFRRGGDNLISLGDTVILQHDVIAETIGVASRFGFRGAKAVGVFVGADDAFHGAGIVLQLFVNDQITAAVGVFVLRGHIELGRFRRQAHRFSGGGGAAFRRRV